MSVDEKSADWPPVTDFDYVSGSSQQESDAKWQEQREKCPVAWSSLYGGHWVLSRYAEVSAAFRDWETFSSERQHPDYVAITIVPGKHKLVVPEELIRRRGISTAGCSHQCCHPRRRSAFIHR